MVIIKEPKPKIKLNKKSNVFDILTAVRKSLENSNLYKEDEIEYIMNEMMLCDYDNIFRIAKKYCVVKK